jgi:hypothetical protein
MVRDFIRPTFNLLTGVLRELTPPDLPPRRLQMLGASVVGQVLHYHYARHVLPLLIGEEAYRALDLDTIADHIHQFTLAAVRGLYPPASGGRESPEEGEEG